tara:strand:- start:654 stop:2849 length:2196 start_codon:yes stop_codon:yes gene_type:complete
MLGLGNLLSKGGAVLKTVFNKFSINFDGSNDVLNLSNNVADFTSLNTGTISAWIKPSGSGDRNIINFGDANGNTSIYLRLEPQLAGFVRQAASDKWSLKTNAALSNDTWYHVAVTQDATAPVLYVNGVAVAQTFNVTTDKTFFLNDASGIDTMNIGRRHANNQKGEYFNGLIDEVAIWDVALSANDMAIIGSKVYDLSVSSSYDTDRTANLKLWLRAGDKAQPESTASIARPDFYTSFDGSNAYVDVGSQTSINNLTLSNLSFGCWFKTSGTSKYLFGNEDGNDSGFSMYLKSDGKIRGMIRSATGGYLYNDTASALNDDAWHHVMFTVNLNSGTASGSEGKIYVDGVYEDSGSWNENVTLRAGDSDFTIGTSAGNTSNEFEGQISSLALYQTILNAQTISDMAKSRFTKLSDFSTNLVGGWEMGSGSSDAHPTIQDVSSNDNDGTMTNMDTNDLVYSSILPDQSFLSAGANSPYNFIDLDGTDAYIHTGVGIGDALGDNYDGAFTMGGWFKADSTSGNHPLFNLGVIDNQPEVQIKVQSNGIAVRFNNNAYAPNVVDNAFSDTSNWHQLILVWGGISAGRTGVKIYLDNSAKSLGTDDASDFPSSGDMDFANKPFVIGEAYSNNNWNGKVSNCFFYSKALSAGEVGGLYALGRHGNISTDYSSNLLGYWAMGSMDAVTGLEDTHPTVYDRSGNANHGTLTSGVASDFKSPPNAEPEGYKKGDTNRSTTIP